MDKLIWASASSLAGMIRERRVTAVEVVAALLSRIEQVNGELNAVVQLARDEVRGPLHGVPITIKDSLDTAGIVSTGGTTGRREFVPDHDATVVRRLRLMSRVRAAAAAAAQRPSSPRVDRHSTSAAIPAAASGCPRTAAGSPGWDRPPAAFTVPATSCPTGSARWMRSPRWGRWRAG